MSQAFDVVIIGAGQAGLSLSHELTRSNREHVIFERGRIGQGWRARWDSFCLVLPNWTVRLAGQPYDRSPRCHRPPTQRERWPCGAPGGPLTGAAILSAVRCARR